MRHIYISIGAIIVSAISLGTLLQQKLINIDLFSALMVIIIAIAGYIYQSGENIRLQNLEYKRKTYATLMEHLALFKKVGDKTGEEKKELTKTYFRSWAETSDDVNKKILEYFKSYIAWTKIKKGEEDKKEAENQEIETFDKLTGQIKKEINPKSKEKFISYYFK
ncbi:hypothetical protein MYX06_02625 [Patescibacteria group bacterium AH-259-L05]|nr:hypothetical protein [Patescibacteria group bacterium AH-259-L05]